MGGTAVHMVHGNTRFSEDLDFDNRGIPQKDFPSVAGHLKQALEREGISVEVKTACRGACHIYLTFPGMLYKQGLSAQAQEKMVIRIDAEPQQFDYNPDIILLNKFDVFMKIGVVPAPVMLAQKISCVFTRKRQMGRDYFDIVFLMGKTRPDMRYLSEKLGIADAGALKERLIAQCAGYSFELLAKDVEPFLFSRRDALRVREFREFIQTADF